MSRYKVSVTCSQLVETGSLSRDDRDENPAGYYSYTAFARNPSAAEAKGLDQFHRSVPISNLEDFEVSARARRAYKVRPYFTLIEITPGIGPSCDVTRVVHVQAKSLAKAKESCPGQVIFAFRGYKVDLLRNCAHMGAPRG